MMIPRSACCGLLVWLVTGLSNSSPADELLTLSGETMGTNYEVRFIAAEPLAPEELRSEIDAVLERINSRMSTYREDSELSRFNRHAGAEPFPVSGETCEVVERALAVAAESGGAFDPTVGPLVRLWNFGPDRGRFEPPADAALRDAMEHVGHEQLKVSWNPPALRKADPQIELDLNAIAKGYGVDQVAELLEERGIAAYLVEIGGEVRTRGVKPDGSPWQIGIERPLAGERTLHSIVPLSDAALATSGGYRNFHEHDGVRYSHTIDPRTGRPITHDLASVSVLADDCMTADAWATALMVLGPEEGRSLAEAYDISAYFLIREGDRFIAQSTGTFPAVQVQPPEMPAPVNDHWTTFLLALGVFAVALLGLGIGTLLSNRRLRGSCGGLAGLRDDQGRPVCEACTNPAAECDEFRKQVDVEAAAAGGTGAEDRSASRSDRSVDGR